MSATPRPRVSVLIPNFNNGRQTSISGRDDQIGNLLTSLHDTLQDDPTPFEILVYDDGSTDDSLETLRQWSTRTRPDGRPFLDLIEAEHCGVLSRTANILSRRAQGEFLARLDGDVVCLTPQWVSQLCEVFDTGGERLGIVGPKQLAPDGTILSFGDWVFHPGGYTHIGAGLQRDAVHHPMEVDHVMGCFYCHRKRVFDELGGYDEDFLRGQTVDFGLRARLAGWRCIAVPHIEFVHAHCLRAKRATKADEEEGILYSMNVFERKWGFHRVAPDLDFVARQYANTPLLWNRQWYPADEADMDTVPPGSVPPVAIENSAWSRYAGDEGFRHEVDLRLKITIDMIRQTGTPALAAQAGCGQGLLLHLLAMQGVACVGLDPHHTNLELARQCVAGRPYPAARPRFEQQTDRRHLPLADGEADLLLLFGQMERHPNPIALLREASRVIPPGGRLLIISRRKPPDTRDPSDPAVRKLRSPEHLYEWRELLNQTQATGAWQLLVDPDRDDPALDLIVAAERKREIPRISHTTTRQPSISSAA